MSSPFIFISYIAEDGRVWEENFLTILCNFIENITNILCIIL